LSDLTLMKVTVARFAGVWSTLQCGRYGNITMDPLATGRGSLGIRVAHFVNYSRVAAVTRLWAGSQRNRGLTPYRPRLP